MSKISCGVCKDLLTLYVDGLTCEESERLVEEHITECQDCKSTYEAMKDAGVTKVSKGDKMAAEQFKHSMRKIQKRFLSKKIRTILVSAFGISVVLLTAFYFLFFRYYTVAADEAKITDVCMLENGNIAFKAGMKDGSAFMTAVFIRGDYFENGEKDALYMRAKHTLISIDNDWPAEYYDAIVNYKDVDIEDDIIDYVYKKIYFGLPDDENKILIWEEGDEIPKASEEIEKYFYVGETN